MKRWLIGGVMIIALALLNGENRTGTDIAELEPAQVLWVDEAGAVEVRTDMGQMGRGRNLDEAVRDMEQTAAGRVFLETAEYLLVTPGGATRLDELCRLLRPSCKVCLINGNVDLEMAANYLAVHKPAVTLGDFQKGEWRLPILYIKEERMYLANP